MTNKNTIADMSVTPANNQDILGQNATGGADANTIETLFQNTWGILARAYGDQGGLGTVGGSANAITLTSLSTYQALTSGMQIGIKPTAANTGATTLNLDSLGAKKVRLRGDAALPAGAMAANGRYLLQYDAAYDTAAGAWVLMNPEIPSDVLTASSTNTVTNKRITDRVLPITSSATPTVNTDDYDGVTITALATAITSMTSGLSGTPTNFQKLIYRIKDNGTARAITWGSSFEAKGVALPTTTVISKVLTVGFIYDTVTSKWGCVASAQEA